MAQVIRQGWSRVLAAAIGFVLVPSTPVRADEGGASVYLLGSGGPGAAVLPPVEGVILQNDTYFYDGSASAEKSFEVGGNVVAGLDAQILADFVTLAWIPTTDFASGTLLVGAALPAGAPMVDVNVVVSGPLGGQAGVSRSDSQFVIGDPLLTASLGWTTGKTHIAVSGLVNVPLGTYREDQLANLSFHRWAEDLSLAATYLDPKSGWDLSAKAGVTFNGRNHYTDYNSGNDFHLEASVEKKFAGTWSAGIQGYYFNQISGDSGAGAKLGPFEGEVTGAGATIAHDFTINKMPSSLRLKVLTEFGARNRLEGTTVLLTFVTPLSLKLPQAPPPAQPES